MFKAIVTASALTLAVASGAYAQSSTGAMQSGNSTMAPATDSNNNNPGSAKSQSNVDTGTTGSVTGNMATDGGADGSSGSCNATQTGKNTDVKPAGKSSNAPTTNC